MYKYDHSSTGLVRRGSSHVGRAETNDVTEEEGWRRRRQEEVQQYGLSLTQVPEVWRLTTDYPDKYPNTPVKVCIIDTGYDSLHEDLPKDWVTGTETGYGDPMIDGDGHGTHVAGVIGALGQNGLGIVGGEKRLRGRSRRAKGAPFVSLNAFFFAPLPSHLLERLERHAQSTPTRRNSPSTYPRP